MNLLLTVLRLQAEERRVYAVRVGRAIPRLSRPSPLKQPPLSPVVRKEEYAGIDRRDAGPLGAKDDQHLG